VSQFLDYARPFELKLELCDWAPVVTRALALVRAQGIPANVALVEALDDDLPPVRMDPVRMTQVVLNLVQNGLQSMDQGGTLTVGTRAGRDRVGRAQVEIHVVDTGGGITEEVRDRLFVPFFTTKPHGTGLGLAISQRIVHAHGGEIDVWSVPGEGTSFVVRLPVDGDA
jgi:signal transduction histidine kinase